MTDNLLPETMKVRMKRNNYFNYSLPKSPATKKTNKQFFFKRRKILGSIHSTMKKKKDLNTHFQKSFKMSKNYMKICSSQREVAEKMKITMKYYCILFGVMTANMKNFLHFS